MKRYQKFLVFVPWLVMFLFVRLVFAVLFG